MEKRVSSILHKGKRIIYGDYSNLRGADFIGIIEQQEAMSLQSPEKNLLHLLNFTNTKMDDAAKQRANQMVANLQAKGYTVKTACFGIEGIQRIIAGAVKRDMHFGKSMDDAKDWLTS